MKKLLALTLALIMLIPAAVSCAPTADQLDPAITLASSDAQTKAEWLDNRLDEIPDHVIMGIGSNETYGIDMTNFDDIGYIARAIDGDVFLFGASADGLDRACREYAKVVDAGAQNSLDTVYGEGAWIEELTIAGRDISEFTIVYEDDGKEPNIPYTRDMVTTGNAKYAAEVLSSLIEDAAGVLLPVQSTDTDTPKIKIGFLPDDGTYGHQAFAYEVKGGNVYINGMKDSNGCSNGVYFFLENELNWEGLTYGDAYLREAESVDIPNGTSYSASPMFDYISFHFLYCDDFENPRADLGYSGIIGQASHSMGKYLGLGYEMDENGICYTSEENYIIVRDSVSDELAAYKASGKVLEHKEIDLGTPDGDEKCFCTKCKRIYNEEGQSHAGALLRFVNRIEEEMDSEGYDGVKYQFFAYAGFNIPPKVTLPNGDIYITYCSNAACYVHLMDGSECSSQYNNVDHETTNKHHDRWLRGWCAVSDNVYHYAYFMCNLFHEFTAMDNVYEDMHYMYDIGCAGYAIGSAYNGLGLMRLRNQMSYEVIWHPEMTKAEYDIRYDEIMEREYGDGWGYVKDFIDIWYSTERNLGCLSNWNFATLFEADQCDPVMYAQRAEEMYGLLERARAEANTERQEMRVERLIISHIAYQCQFTYFTAYEKNDSETMALLEERWALIWDYAEHSKIAQKLLVDGTYHWAQYGLVPQKDLHENAWFIWGRENNYFGEGEPTREPPEWVTATTET